ncbi:O-methyltransferase [Listeria costaricensis]|uniref:O-methyltransferase n=1 Tax=Listeria costaricensis TaxID=2026604 RepID=UPI000C08853A|nr:O-methyltransferase [Listeria costaricensis]
MKERIHDYLLAQVPPRSPFFTELESVAKRDQVPIMEPDSLAVMLQVMAIAKTKRILEIGSAIGYSALRMCEALPDATIVTIERDEARFLAAQANIARYGADDRVEILLGDALLDAEKLCQKGPFDAIFIDAAKGQYEKFFQLFAPVLTDGGIIYTDNVLFKGLALEESEEVQKKARIARKMREFNVFLNQQSAYTTVTIPLGDGLAITRRKQFGVAEHE